jgi:2-polyprenyl-3-methyl-5-hydroxy-6-metoxy-1,4-benzoquinol methylase
MPFAAFTTRRLRPEIMDQPQLDSAEHERALRGLERLNLASRVAARFWREIEDRLGPAPHQVIRLLDIASGGGDVPLSLWRRARRRGVTLEILGVDKSETACHHAAKRAAGAAGQIKFQQHEVVHAALPAGFDIVTCSLFLHHLPAGDVIDLLKRMSSAAPLLLVSDLRRNLRGYALAQAACRLLTRSPIVHADGPQSVANAFSLAEMRQLCHDAELHDATVTRTWPCRMLIVRDKDSRRD